MKNLLALIAIFLTATGAVTAHASPRRTWTIDLTKNFGNVDLNLMGEGPGMPTGGVGVDADIILPAPPGVEFVIGVGGSAADSSKYLKACQIEGMMRKGNVFIVRVAADLAPDNGDACILRVSYSNHRQAIVRLYMTGT